jgi:hypothetical protein
MANPFDEFDPAPASASASKGGNPFDEFDSNEGEADLASQIPGMPKKPKKRVDESTMSDKLLGAGEAALTAITGVPATIAGAITGLASGDGMAEKDKIAGEIAQKFTYSPRSEKGQDYAENVGEAANQLLNPLMGGLGHIQFPKVKVPDLGGLSKDRAALDALRKEPTLNAETPPPQPPTGPQGPPPKLQPGQTQGELFGQQFTPYIERRGQPDLFSDEVTYPPKDAEAIRTELRWLHEKQLDESRQAMDEAFAQSHNDFIKRQLESADAEATRREQAAAEQADVQNRVRQMNDQLIGDKLERADNAANNGEIRNAMGANDTLIAKLNELEANRGNNPLYVDPQGQAFRGNPAEPIAARAGDMARDALNKEQTWMKGQGTPPEGQPLRPLTDVLNPRPDRPVDPVVQKAIAAAQRLDTESSPKGRVPKGQRGGVTTDLLTLGLLPKSNPVRQIMTKNKDGNFIPDNPSPKDFETIMEKARGEKDGKSFRLLDSGAQLTAMKRQQSTVIRTGGDLVEGAFKRADLKIRNDVFPAEDSIRSLSREQVQILGNLLKEEMFAGARFTPQRLSAFTPKIQNAYRILREAFDKALVEQNSARAAQGKPPIKPQEAYLSSRWQGDFRRPLFDAKGKVVWFLSGETKMGLNAQTRAVLKDHPDLTFDPKKDFVVRFWNRKTDMESAYTTMLDILGRDDPAVQKLQAYMEEITKGNAASFLNQEKHFKQKGNAHGFVGDRPQLTVNDFTDRNIPFGDKIVVANRAKHEAIAMFEQQMQYMKNAIRWSELQKITDQFKQLVNDPHLVEHQPNNIKYLRDYYKQALGYGESRFTRAMADSLRDFGVSPEPFDRAVGGMKSFFILDKLAESIGFIATQGLQISMIVPHMIDLAVKGRFVSNPLKAIAAGLFGGITMGTGHQFNALAKGKARFEGIPHADFFNRAYKYAEDNGITARSIYDESPISSSFSTIGKVGKFLGRSITLPETYIRSAAFMTLSQFLKDSGKYTNEADIFREAERRTNVSMTDYAKTERPMLFQKLGSLGNFINTLQTFAFNYYNQFSYFYREAKKGNVMPLMAALALQYAVSGVMGQPYVDDAYKALMSLKDHLPAKYWQKIQDNEFLREPKMWTIKNFGTSTAYGMLSDKLGINLSSRLAAPSGGQMLTSPIGPATEIAKQAMSVGSALIDPTNTTKWAQAAMDVNLEGLKGAVETSPIMEGHTYNKRPNGTTEVLRPTKLMQREGLVVRTPEDTRIRALGLRSMNETVQRDVNYATKRDQVAAADKSKDLVNAYYDAVRRGDKKDAADMFKTYEYINGKKITAEQVQAQVKQEYLTDSERAVDAVKGDQPNLQQILAVARAMAIHDAIVKEHANGNQPTR